MHFAIRKKKKRNKKKIKTASLFFKKRLNKDLLLLLEMLIHHTLSLHTSFGHKNSHFLYPSCHILGQTKNNSM